MQGSPDPVGTVGSAHSAQLQVAGLMQGSPDPVGTMVSSNVTPSSGHKQHISLGAHISTAIYGRDIERIVATSSRLLALVGREQLGAVPEGPGQIASEQRRGTAVRRILYLPETETRQPAPQRHL